MKTLRKYFLVICAAVSIFGTASVLAEPMPTSASQSVMASDVAIKVVGQQLEIVYTGSHNTQLVVYALTGQVVKTMTISPGTVHIDLPSGYYIVKCNNMTQRVVVR